MLETYKELIKNEAEAYKLDPRLIAAVVLTESGGNPWACRYEPEWKYFLAPDRFAGKCGVTVDTEKMLQACSWGLMQVMGSVCREIGYNKSLTMVCDPSVGLRMGCIKLKSLVTQYKTEEEAIVSYNAGSPRKNSDLIYVNQAYLNRVLYFKNSDEVIGLF